VGEKVLGIEARIFHAAVGEVALAGAEDFQEREGFRHGKKQRPAGASGPYWGSSPGTATLQWGVDWVVTGRLPVPLGLCGIE
jgi:hypothetical protein